MLLQHCATMAGLCHTRPVSDAARRPPSLMGLPSYLAGSVARIGHDHLVSTLDAHDLRLPQYAVLAALSDFGPLAPHELATRLQADRSHISTYVEALARRGWVRREPDPLDRRRHRVALTDPGAAVFADLREAAAASQSTFLRVLTDQERRTLLDLLAKVIVHEDAQRSGPPSSSDRSG